MIIYINIISKENMKMVKILEYIIDKTKLDIIFIWIFIILLTKIILWKLNFKFGSLTIVLIRKEYQ